MKKLSRIILSLFLAFSLTGCIKVEMNMDVKKDGTIDVELTELFDSELLKSYDPTWTPESMLRDEEDLTGIVEELDIVKQESYSREFNGKTWEGFRISGSLKKERTKEILKIEDGKMILNFAGFDNEENASDTSNILDQETRDEAAQYIAMGGVVELNISMPNEIQVEEVEGLKLSEDKKTVTIDLLKFQGDNIKLTCNLSNNTWICAVVGVGALAIVIFLFIRRTRKECNVVAEEVLTAESLDLQEEDKKEQEQEIEQEQEERQENDKKEQEKMLNCDCEDSDQDSEIPQIEEADISKEESEEKE